MTQRRIAFAMSAVLSAVSARRPLTMGMAGAVVVAGIPELAGRHDPGAMFEPGALTGALMQWVVLLLVIAVAVAVEAHLAGRPLIAKTTEPPDSVAVTGAVEAVPRTPRSTSLSRAPPRVSCSLPV